jgi:hypothetical protein
MNLALDDSSATQRVLLPPSWRKLYSGPLLPGNEASVVAARRTALHRRVQRALANSGESLPDL